MMLSLWYDFGMEAWINYLLSFQTASAKAVAVASPMPAPAPVTSATLPSKDISIFSELLVLNRYGEGLRVDDKGISKLVPSMARSIGKASSACMGSPLDGEAATGDYLFGATMRMSAQPTVEARKEADKLAACIASITACLV
jgi:hypothetical protein